MADPPDGPTQPTPPPPVDTGPSVPRWLPAGATLVVLVAFIAFQVVLLVTADAPDTVWQRRLYVLGSLEAVVFTAVGWLFGREVHRERAAAAEDAVDREAGAASMANERATRAETAGEQLSRTIQALGARTRTGHAAGGVTDIGGRPVAPDLDPAHAISLLEELAHQLYPARR